jgi:hypothetical protein
MAPLAVVNLADCLRLGVNLRHLPLDSRDAPNMIRTPTTSVTAIAIAARAFAWDVSGGAPFSGPRPADSGSMKSKLRLLAH